MTEMAIPQPPKKADAALALKLAGASWSEIAAALNFKDEKAARAAVERSAAANVSDDDRLAHRNVANLRYERLLRATMVMALNPKDSQQLSAIRTAREIVDRLVALNGAAVPVEIIVTNPTEQELMAWVTKVAQIEAPAVQEVDIFDAEVVSDTPGDGQIAS